MTNPLVIRPRPEDLAGLPILRPIPSAQCRSVGPFVFFDHMLATAFAPGQGMNVRQHPHIGLSTLTYLFEGTLQHKDSLGSDQRVGPGDVSWMTAGAGVAHVERTPAELLASGSRLHGLQVWLALPREQEQGAPRYSHHPATSLPQQDSLGVSIRLIAGHGFCLESPVPVTSPTLYAELRLQTGATLLLPDEHPQRALYLLDGEALLDDQPLERHSLTRAPRGRDLQPQRLQRSAPGDDRRRPPGRPEADELELRRQRPGPDRRGPPALGSGRLAGGAGGTRADRTAALTSCSLATG